MHIKPHDALSCSSVLLVLLVLSLLLPVPIFLPVPAWALDPGELVVIANRSYSGSVGLARYYMKKRGIPKDNLVIVRTTDREACSREEYDKRIAKPVRAFLQKKDPHGVLFRCLVTVYGIPLSVAPPELDRKEKDEVERLKHRIRDLQSRIKEAEASQEETAGNELKNLKRKLKEAQQEMKVLRKADQASALDSELSLVVNGDYPLSGWIPNPHFLEFREKQMTNKPDRVIMVSRLDGPSEDTVRRIIDDSLTAEEEGLRGKACFDARWPDPGKKEVSGYAFYDRSIHRAADRIRESGAMPVALDEAQRLFQPGECSEAAFYCGWYSLARYVDAFTWVPGAVGYHIASSECQTLKRRSSKVWCKMMLEKGVAATVGPVGEPYVQAFPVPEVFFAALLDGRLSLAECYAVSTPFLSWKMVLIGDPLYRPFKQKAESNRQDARNARR